MGVWKEAYVDKKDSEPDYYCGNSNKPYDYYYKSEWKEGDLPDYFHIVKPIHNSCWTCKNNGLFSGYCILDFTLYCSPDKHTCNKYSKRDDWEPCLVWSFIYPCWRQFFLGNELGYKKWIKTEEGTKYYQLAEEYLRREGLLDEL